MIRLAYSRIGRAALVSAALIFAGGTSLAKAPGGGHGGGGGGHGGGGGGHGGGGGGGGRGFSGGGGGHSFSSGGGRSFSGGSPSFSRSAPAGMSRSTSFSPNTANAHRNNGTLNNGTWNHNGNWNNANWNHWNNNWNHNHNNFDHHHNNFGFFFGWPFWGWGGGWFGGGYPWPYFYNGFPAWYYWNDYASNYSPGPAYVSTPDGAITQTDQAPPPPADMPKLDDNAVLIGVRVPESAVIWFDGEKTTQTGTFREFMSPPLEPGQKYTYEIKAVWVENGQEVSRMRRVDVFAGDRLMVNMQSPAKSAQPRGPGVLPPPKPAPPSGPPKAVPPAPPQPIPPKQTVTTSAIP